MNRSGTIIDGAAWVIVHQERKNLAKSLNCNRSAALQMREIGLRAIARLCKQAYDKADAVLLNVYELVG